MKTCLAIGDLFVPAEAMRMGLAPLEEMGYRIETVTFDPGDYDALQGACRRIERDGPASVTLGDDLLRRMRRVEMLVVHFCPVDRSVLGGNPNLELVGTCRTGMSNIDLDSARDEEITVVNCRGRLADAVADFTVGLMICEARNIARGHVSLKNGEWRRRYHNLGHIPDLSGRTVGLVGLGAIGRAVARRLRGFDMKILGVDPYIDPDSVRDLGIEMTTLDQLMQAADFISIHVDLRPETKDLIDRRRLRMMKREAYLINTARAEIVNEEALIEALASDWIAGAALDVYKQEPLSPGHPFLKLDNVTLTPHMSGGSDDALRRSPALLCRLIMKELENEK